MFFKFIFSLILFASSLFAEVLDVSKAFVLSPSIDEQGAEIKFKFGENIYLYKDSFEVKLGEEKINSLLNMPKSENTVNMKFTQKIFRYLSR